MFVIVSAKYGTRFVLKIVDAIIVQRCRAYDLSLEDAFHLINKGLRVSTSYSHCYLIDG